MWPTAPAVGSRHTESTLSHVVATEDLRSSRQLCRPSRGFSGASSLLSPHGCGRGPHSCARPGGLQDPIEPILAPMPPRERAVFSTQSPLPTAHLPTASVHRCGGGAAELDFLHQKHKRDHGEEGKAKQPECVGISEHAGLPEHVAIDQAMGLVERLHRI